MKKFQYAISIAVGIVIGAMVALMIGNTTTAILSGVVSASFTAWIGSLQWGEARKFAAELAVAAKIDIANNVRAAKNAVTWMKNIARAISKAAKWLLLAPIKLTIVLAGDVNARKTALAIMTVLGITAIYVVFVLSSLKSSFIYRGDVAISLRFFLGVLPMVIIIVVTAFCMLLIRIDIVDIAINNRALTPSEALNLRVLSEDRCFFANWFYQLIQDDRGAVASIARMLYIRTGNALRIIAYPFVLALWGAVALANNKTGISALTAMVLSGLHLGIAYLTGGIDTGNANFWLSLIVAMGLGAALGRKVSAMREPAAHRSLPSLKLRDQVAFHRS